MAEEGDITRADGGYQFIDSRNVSSKEFYLVLDELYQQLTHFGLIYPPILVRVARLVCLSRGKGDVCYILYICEPVVRA